MRKEAEAGEAAALFCRSRSDYPLRGTSPAVQVGAVAPVQLRTSGDRYAGGEGLRSSGAIVEKEFVSSITRT